MNSGSSLATMGLILDAIAFLILSADLVRTLNNERMARDEILDLEHRAHLATYALPEPDHESVAMENEVFRLRQAARKEKTDADMRRRWAWALAAIFLALVGAALQIWGSVQAQA